MTYDSDVAAADALRATYQKLNAEISKVIIGQDEVIRLLLTAIFCQGHCLLVGVPGLAKTLLIQTMAAVLDLDFNRIQFTPDLMPSDILGSETLDQDRNFKFVRGPVFANIILADEINRTPPKTQSALLEAMQEYAVTIAGQKHPLGSCWPPRTRSSKKALTRCPKPSSTVSCSTFSSTTPVTSRKWTS